MKKETKNKGLETVYNLFSGMYMFVVAIMWAVMTYLGFSLGGYSICIGGVFLIFLIWAIVMFLDYAIRTKELLFGEGKK